MRVPGPFHRSQVIAGRHAGVISLPAGVMRRMKVRSFRFSVPAGVLSPSQRTLCPETSVLRQRATLHNTTLRLMCAWESTGPPGRTAILALSKVNLKASHRGENVGE